MRDVFPLRYFTTKCRLFFILLLGFLALTSAGSAHAQSVQIGQFEFSEWNGPPLNIFYAEANGLNVNAPIVIVMHGVDRNADDYRDNWIELARTFGFFVYAPEFDKARFPKSANYNLGGLTKSSGRAFDAMEPLFDAIKARRGATQTGYYLFGHSAGGQFVHRYVFFGKPKRMKLALAANSGWYTLPTRAAKWPYGLAGLKRSLYDVDALLKAPLTILLGDQDIDPYAENLRHTPEADAQGMNRYDRGIYFLKRSNTIAEQRQIRSAWSYHVVPGVAHDNAAMAVAAAALVDQHAKEN
jgi:poly(3-hydroxybutyrate) depolymerase